MNPSTIRGSLAASILSLIAATLTLGEPIAADIHPSNLRCEYRQNPLGIEVAQPRLSWTLEAAPTARGQVQSAYRVLVASTLEKLAGEEGDWWDSGKVVSGQSTHVVYAGKPLPSRMRVWWKVRAWDRNGQASAWSEPALWSMGLLEPGDWADSRWIAATERLTAPPVTGVAGYHALEARTADELKWVQVDLRAQHVLHEVRVYPPAPSGFEQVKGFGFPVRFRVEASDDPGFQQSQLIEHFTAADYPNPGNESRAFAPDGVRGRYVRVTATRLWNRQSGAAPFCFALAELEVWSHGTNVALGAPVRAKDSVESSGWSLSRLTDGEKLVSEADPGPAQPGNRAILLRKAFTAEGKVTRATAYVGGLGYSELEINGGKVGADVLDPGFTDFTRRVLYRTYDVTEWVRKGANAIGVQLGGGWFNLATADLFGFERAPWSASPRLRFRLVIEYADGRIHEVVSDESWKGSTGAITFNCVRGGETIDAREEKLGWSQAGYDDGKWQPAMPVDAPAGKLVSQQHPPIRVTASIRPVGITEPKPGVYVFDLGINIAGWARLTTRGPRGTRVTLEYNELLNADGTVNMRHNRSHTRGRFQTGECILRGEGWETFEPRFTYHGFRYVQVTGLVEPPTLDTLMGRWVTTAPEPAGHFTCSNDRVNQLQEVFLRTFLNNLHGIPTDCPQREKMGWLNDGCVSMEAIFLNFDTPTLYRKWFDDIVDAQDPNGHVPDFAPTSGWGRTRPDGSPGEMADPWWGGAIVLVPWKLYQHYGDVRILAESLPSMQAYVDYLGTTAQGHRIEWGLGDWLDDSAGGGARRVPVAQTSTAAYAYYAAILSRTAALLDRNELERKYAALAREITEAFNREYLDPLTGLYAKDSQTAQALPLVLGLAPKPAQARVLDQLVHSIKGPRQYHISAGIVGALYVFHALMEHERNDLAWAVLTQEDYPGWLHMLNQGGTAIWETWNGEHSRNHPTFGCVGFWFYQGLAGIRPDPSAPGFERIIIKPAIVGDLTWVRCSHQSLRGKIEIHWRHEDGKLRMEVTIPANTTATVHVPTSDPDAITESGRPVQEAAGVRFLRATDHAAVFEVGSGRYLFESLFPPVRKPQI